MKSIRSKANYAAARKLSDKYGCEIEFAGHDLAVYAADNKTLAGDIDSFFTSEHIDFLMERKRTVGSSIVEQIVRTRDAYAASLEARGIVKTVVSILYAESIPEKLVGSLKSAGVHLLQDAVEARFCDDVNGSIEPFLRKWKG